MVESISNPQSISNPLQQSDLGEEDRAEVKTEDMARTRSAGGGGRRSRGGGTAALVAVPRRSARLAGGNNRSPAHNRSPVPSCAHSRSPSSQGSPQRSPTCQGSPQSHRHSTPPFSCPKSPYHVSPSQSESDSLPRKPHIRRPPFLLPTPPAPLSNPLTSNRAFSHASLIFSLLLSFILLLSLH